MAGRPASISLFAVVDERHVADRVWSAARRSVIVGVGTLMFFQDPDGNVFGAMQYDPRAE